MEAESGERVPFLIEAQSPKKKPLFFLCFGFYRPPLCKVGGRLHEQSRGIVEGGVMGLAGQVGGYGRAVMDRCKTLVFVKSYMASKMEV